MAEGDVTSEPGAACLALLRETDRDRYLACLLSPVDRQGALAGLYAFSAELARVRDLVREPLPGEIRLQYWRDLLSGAAHGETSGNPLAVALLDSVSTYRLPVEALLAMIDARVGDLYDDPIGPRAALEGYAGETASALIQLASLILDADQARESSDCAGHAGVAQSIAGLLLLLPQHRARGQLYIPDEILTATGLDRDSFLAGEDRIRLAAALEAFAGLGLDHLQKARLAWKGQNVLLPAYLPVALAGPVLSKARRHPLAFLDGQAQRPQWRRQLTLFKASLTKKF
ncbi:phytoene/squalene synthase family protein [Allorhizobium sp. BGMRC 0089]|uniref:phytoene/squalene synthase family protein n=1 Tax=Allorhizobium sonneratiae TaxID=2934936 RepID=UPI0020347216|nr:phytoene/squalene synthase family protein [Allorhizobium sonneratiae]MCM2294281.1 phytoene/squalene synthase family protein [Allorhizobium sonneratiae]